MINKYIFFTVSLLCAFLSFSQENCDYDVIPCDFPCVEYVINNSGCPVCECSDGWTPINEDGCYDSNSVTYSPGYQFFINECEYVTCLQVEDGWGGFLDSGIWSEVINLDDCIDFENDICPNTITIPSNSYTFFNDSLNQIAQEILLLPVTITGNFSISSYQFNLIYNHQSVNLDLESFNLVNNTNFYNIYDLPPTHSNMSNGGMFSVNTIEINDTSSISSIAYATSQAESLIDILLYIPLIINSEECFNLNFSNGFINNEYIFPNQTNELLVSNQDLSECAIDGTVCFTCIDENENMLCDELEISGCTDLNAFNYNEEATFDNGSCVSIIYGCLDNTACNYNIEANVEDESCIYEGESCFIYINSNCCCCGVCDCVCEEFIEYPFMCESEITGDYTNSNIVLEGQIENCECTANDILGCTDILACNYNESANTDDNSCFYPDSCGSCDSENLLHSIELPGGWSYFSTYLCPLESNMENIMLDLVDSGDLIIVKNDNGDVYWPTFNINGIGDIINGKAYLIKTLNQSVLNISGNLLSYDFPITINSGWSYLGYLHQETGLIENLMAPIANNLIIIKDYIGNVYWPTFGIDQIINMNPGMGYQIKIQDDLVFSYPSLDLSGRFSNHNIINNPYFQSNLNTGNNMTIGIPDESWVVKPNTEDLINAYDSSGILVGQANYNEKGTVITVWGNDLTTNKKDGLNIGEEIEFKLLNYNTNTEKDISISKWQEGGGRYIIDGISIADKVTESLNLITHRLYQNKPNPFNGTTTIKFYTPFDEKVSIKIFNMLGEHVADVTNDVFNSGTHEIKFSSSQLSQGIYCIKMATKDFTSTKNMNIIK